MRKTWILKNFFRCKFVALSRGRGKRFKLRNALECYKRASGEFKIRLERGEKQRDRKLRNKGKFSSNKGVDRGVSFLHFSREKRRMSNSCLQNSNGKGMLNSLGKLNYYLPLNESDKGEQIK